ncbi:hypothetical protein PF003_g3227 [Phytophthora fragariae]|nr:hypothetical protein PF003_g3227 [Phytophthora fragariae]
MSDKWSSLERITTHISGEVDRVPAAEAKAEDVR